MNQDNQQETKKSKKRYIAIAALACLVATGGTVGAIVTAETKVEGNQVSFEENNPNLEITGDPFLAVIDMNDPAQKKPTDGNLTTIASKTWVLENKDPKANAKVKITSNLKNLVPLKGPGSDDAKFTVTQKAESSSAQVIADAPLTTNIGGFSNATFNLRAGAKTTITLEVKATKAGWDFFKPGLASEKFPVAFEYTRG